LAAALRAPTFVVYLGRKSCPPALPFAPRVVDVDDAERAFADYLVATPAGPRAELLSKSIRHDRGDRLAIAADEALVPAARNKRDRRVRRDQPDSRRRRQFSTRSEIWFDEAPS
jgi:CRISPR system Cascade subunit CasD